MYPNPRINGMGNKLAQLLLRMPPMIARATTTSMRSSGIPASFNSSNSGSSSKGLGHRRVPSGIKITASVLQRASLRSGELPIGASSARRIRALDSS